MARGNLEGAQRSAVHMVLEAQPDLPCLPLRPCLLPSAPHLPYFYHTDFFFSVFQIHATRSCLRAFALAVSSPWEALFFLIPS